jgi:hypothetical protein
MWPSVSGRGRGKGGAGGRGDVVVAVVGAVVGGVEAAVEIWVEGAGRCVEVVEVVGVEPHPAAHTAAATLTLKIAESWRLRGMDGQPMTIGVPRAAKSHTTTESPAGTRTHPWLAG